MSRPDDTRPAFSVSPESRIKLPLTLLASVVALIGVWAMAVVGLSLTIKRAYRHTFVSLQTGYADTQSIFLDRL